MSCSASVNVRSKLNQLLQYSPTYVMSIIAYDVALLWTYMHMGPICQYVQPPDNLCPAPRQ